MSKVFFYVQHLLGIGHLRRASLIAEAAAVAGLDVDLVTGGVLPPGFAPRGVGMHQLPALKAGPEGFSDLRDEAGGKVSKVWLDERRDQLLRLFAERAPDLLLIEAFPFGRRQMRFELLPLIEAAHKCRPRPLIVSSVRDILQVSSKPGRSAEITTFLGDMFDHILVHGDRDFVRFEETFPGPPDFAAADTGVPDTGVPDTGVPDTGVPDTGVPDTGVPDTGVPDIGVPDIGVPDIGVPDTSVPDIAAMVSYTGIVAPPETHFIADATTPRGEVVVSAGGGTIAKPLLLAALGARPLSVAKDIPWRLIAGPGLDEDAFSEVAQKTPAGVILERYRPDLPALLSGARLSVSFAGYNTVAELLSIGRPAVFVAFASGGESEQAMRVARLQQLGYGVSISDRDLTPASLASAIDKAWTMQPPEKSVIDLNGAARSAQLLSQWIDERSG